jgi:hypothetical protein
MKLLCTYEVGLSSLNAIDEIQKVGRRPAPRNVHQHQFQVTRGESQEVRTFARCDFAREMLSLSDPPYRFVSAGQLALHIPDRADNLIFE